MIMVLVLIAIIKITHVVVGQKNVWAIVNLSQGGGLKKEKN